MNFLSKLFSTKKTSEKVAEKPPSSVLPQIQIPKCPYCQAILKRMPASKTKCSSCGNDMYVRTRLSDNQKVLVTKQKADDMRIDSAIMSGTSDRFLEDQKEYQEEKEILRKRFGQEPSDHDIKWGMLNKQLIEYGRRGDWGLYRNARVTMGDILRREMKINQALETYLEVCYIDLNGPNNTGGIRDAALLRQYPPFRASDGMVFPGIIDYIQRINNKLKLSVAEIEKIYLDHNQKIYTSLRLPVSPEKSWPILAKQI
jgi:DNA-directed RNA polymerase subunit M/transcription elongation factor TFIIS